MPVPVVDVFAGPGGLAEGFASVRTSLGQDAFDVVLSVEKETHAHRTLKLRKLIRRVGEPVTDDVYRRMAAGIQPDTVFESYPAAHAEVAASAVQLELGPQTHDAVVAARGRLRGQDPWVLIGGPPCQAYSLVGRARRRSVIDYVPENDERNTLYLEYLQLLADCEPAAFVMENVKGLLSAVLAAQRMFDRIADDLVDPATALRREGRRACGRPRYRLYAFVGGQLRVSHDSRDYLVRAEQFGVPQARHRVIIIGIRDDADAACLPAPHSTHSTRAVATTSQALDGLPRLRSGISRQPDGPAQWRDFIRGLRDRPWSKSLPQELREAISRCAERATVPRENRGAEAMLSHDGLRIFNHSTRGHIPPDLERYFFAAHFAKVSGRSPTLGDFPRSLLPKHANVGEALASGVFADRFRVQIRNAPSSTVTSHIAKDGHYYIHFDASQCRSLTVREAARLQTFPDDYVFVGPRTAQYLQVGNAVPPLLATQIAAAVHSVIT